MKDKAYKNTLNEVVFHICSSEIWKQVSEENEYTSETYETDGFIHLSHVEQLEWTANEFLSERKDLVLLVIKKAYLDAPIKYVGESHGKPWPHLYGKLNTNAVIKVVPFLPQEDGKFVTPSLETLFGD